MICLALGLGVLGAIAFGRARRCEHHHVHYRHHRHHRRGRWILHAALARIDATPAQERFIVAEIDKLRDRVGGVHDGLFDVRADLAAALRGPQLDDAALGAVLGRVDAATAETRAATLDALRAIHGVLDDKQRAQVADMLDRGGGAGWWRHGPYR